MQQRTRLPPRNPLLGQQAAALRKEASVEDLTYQMYLTDPDVRERLEREARRAQAEAVRTYIVAPLQQLFKRMRTATGPGETSLRIARGSMARIPNGRGLRVSVQYGIVWITQYGNPEDVCLNAGESLRIDHDGLTLLSAYGRTPHSMVTLEPAFEPSLVERLATGVRGLWAGASRTLARPSTSGI
jgi:hypothetical protein